MAGVRMLADEAIRDGRQVTLLFGAASAREVYPSSLLPDEVEYVVATDDGSLGHHGFVTELVADYEALGRPGVRLRPGADARGARAARGRPARAARRRQARPEARRRQGRSGRVAGGATQGVPPGLDGAEHGLRGRGVPRLRGHGHDRHAAAGLPRGPGLRGRGDRLGGAAGEGQAAGRDVDRRRGRRARRQYPTSRRRSGRAGPRSSMARAATRAPAVGARAEPRPRRSPRGATSTCRSTSGAGSSCRTRSSSRRGRSATASSTATSSTSTGSARSAARARRSSRGSATRRRG